MIDVWMIFTMMYPFSAVTLYSVLEFLKEDDHNIPVPLDTSKRNIRAVRFLLDYGLPSLASIFIIIFWLLGIINRASDEKFVQSC